MQFAGGPSLGKKNNFTSGMAVEFIKQRLDVLILKCLMTDRNIEDQRLTDEIMFQRDKLCGDDDICEDRVCVGLDQLLSDADRVLSRRLCARCE